MKQSPLKRKTPLQSHSSLKRSPIQHRKSSKARAKEFSPKVRQTVMERSNGMCERCGVKPIVHLHHARFRSQQGTGELSNAIGLCIPCHDACHSSREVREWAVKMAEQLAKEG